MESVQASRQVAPIRQNEDPLWIAAQALETNFLSEMLKSAGLDSGGGAFGGGVGEDQFSSFLVDAQAQQITNAGGIGLAESLYNALKEREYAE